MAEEVPAALDDSEDVDVIWEGSPLHEHMKQLGLESPDGDVAAKGRLIDSRSRPPAAVKPGNVFSNISLRQDFWYFEYCD